MLSHNFPTAADLEIYFILDRILPLLDTQVSEMVLNLTRGCVTNVYESDSIRLLYIL